MAKIIIEILIVLIVVTLASVNANPANLLEETEMQMFHDEPEDVDKNFEQSCSGLISVSTICFKNARFYFFSEAKLIGIYFTPPPEVFNSRCRFGESYALLDPKSIKQRKLIKTERSIVERVNKVIKEINTRFGSPNKATCDYLTYLHYKSELLKIADDIKIFSKDAYGEYTSPQAGWQDMVRDAGNILTDIYVHIMILRLRCEGYTEPTKPNEATPENLGGPGAVGGTKNWPLQCLNDIPRFFQKMFRTRKDTTPKN